MVLKKNKFLKENCKKGNHDLIVIQSLPHAWDESEQVVKWCRYCGAVVIDLCLDGRTSPGRIMPMRFPQILTDEKL